MSEDGGAIVDCGGEDVAGTLGRRERNWGRGTRCRVASRQTSARRAAGWRGSSPLTQFAAFFIHFLRESCCLKPWQREVTSAHKAKAATLSATPLLTCANAQHLLQSDPHHLYLPTFHPCPGGSFLVYRHPQTLGRVEFLMKTLSQRPESGLDSSPCAAMSGPQVRTPLDVVGVRFRVPARQRRLQAVMREQHTPYDTKGFRDSWLHACNPWPLRSR